MATAVPSKQIRGGQDKNREARARDVHSSTCRIDVMGRNPLRPEDSIATKPVTGASSGRQWRRFRCIHNRSVWSQLWPQPEPTGGIRITTEVDTRHLLFAR